jgi:zinc transporter, ZIP family
MSDERPCVYKQQFELYCVFEIYILTASYWLFPASLFREAVAAGMMVAASISLVWEGIAFTEPHDTSELSTTTRTAMGALLGLCFILGTKGILERYEDLKVGGMDGTDARKALLVFFVMTLHSFSEGVGIGVSFGGTHGSDLGVFISASLAVHNIPEGLAMAVVLLPKGTSTVTAALWAVATSLPQPLMAVPAYLFVHHFIPIVPIGLGFAGGAMAWVAVFELLAEAIEDTDIITTGSVASLSLAIMMFIVEKIEDSARA